MGRIAVIVAPGARATELVGRQGGAWKLRVAAAPERGRATEAVCELVAELAGVPRRDVAVAVGASSRRKLVEVAGVAPEELDARFAAALD